MQSSTLALLFYIVALTAYAQNQLQVSGDLRMRSEYRHGYSTLANENQNNAFFTDQRTRLIIDYAAQKYSVKLSLQDVRIWGSQPQLVRDDGALTAVHEAWGEFRFTKALSVRVGRQEIALDDHRILGNVDWNMQGRAHDALVLKYKNGFEVEGGFAYNQDKAQLSTTFYTITNNYKALQYLWLHKDYKRFAGSFLFLNNGKQGGTPSDYRTRFSQTIGTRWGYKNDRLKLYLAYYHQMGKEADGQQKINAFDISGELNYQLSNALTLTLGAELLSGNNQNTSSTTNRAFNPFYGTNHKFNGLMDYFYVGNHTNSVGLHDYYTHLNYHNNKFTTSFQVHYFETDGDVADPETGSILNASFGTEIDLVFRYKVNEEVCVDAGYSQFLPTTTLQVLKGGSKSEIHNWAWLMVSFKPVFYKTPQRPE